MTETVGRTSWVSDVEATRPSLANLDKEQQTSLDDLADGFVSRTAVLRWVQDLGVVTLGALPDEFGSTLATSDGIMAMLVVSSERERFAVRGEVPSLDVSREFRERLSSRLLPYHRDAIREFRVSAVEYLDDENRPSRNAQSIAHRPSLDELNSRQEEALDALVDGDIESERDLVGWARMLNLATEGEVGARLTDGDRGLAERLSDEPGTRAVLISTPDEPASHEEARIRFAAHHLLPAFNAGVRSLWNRAGEDTTTESKTLSAKSL